MRMVQDDVIQFVKDLAVCPTTDELNPRVKEWNHEELGMDDAYAIGDRDGGIILARQLLQRMGVSYG